MNTAERRQQWAEMIPVDGLLHFDADDDEPCELCGVASSSALVLDHTIVLSICGEHATLIEFTGQGTFREEA